MIKERYCSYELSKLLKEKGFDEPCHHCYGYEEYDGKLLYSFKEMVNSDLPDNCTAPTHQMACDWLRETHNIDIDIEASVGMLGVKVYVPFISTYKPLKDAPSRVHQIKRGIYYKDDKGVIPALQYFDSYEEAIEIALKYCLTKLI